MSLALTGRNDDATALLALYGLQVLPLGLTGPGETGLSVKGKLSDDLATLFSLSAGISRRSSPAPPGSSMAA